VDGLVTTASAAPGPLRIGLTGGIGSGKSTAAAELVALGATLVDTDAIARELTAPGGTAMPALRAAFGDDVADASGALDRAAMRQRAFADPTVKQRLEAVLHPLILQTALQRADEAAARGVPAIVFDVPLLAESGHWRERVQRVLVIDCDDAVQVQRVAARPGWTADAARAVIVQQAPRATRRALADAVIDNTALTRAQLREAVAAVWQRWLGASTGVRQGVWNNPATR
jgi:dephospho-CoA kinase